MRFWVIGLLLLSACERGCPTYTPISGKTLVAHAGGGLPGVDHPNNLLAMDTAYANGIRLIELDFREHAGRLVLEHDRPDSQSMKASAILPWLRAHPDVSIITDFKTDNVRGLRQLASLTGPLRGRFIPQIYQPSELDAIRALGLQKPILTLYRIDGPWRAFANSADIMAVTMPEERVDLARGLTKPVFLHTVNEVRDYPVAGYYTDCLVPAR